VISKMSRCTRALLFLLVVLPALAEILEGSAVRVVDGDTVVLLDPSKEQHRIGLAGIDAAARKRPFGAGSKQYLSDKIARQDAVVDGHKRDRYGRLVGKIIFDGDAVNLSMARAGVAWWYRKCAHEQSAADRVLYEDAETKARAEKVGLWRDPEPIPPWEWRHRR
jgi:endonuclease YncB( thermonuclease family)